MALLYLTRTRFSTTTTALWSAARYSSSLAGVANPIPASFLRGGTSKGIYLNRAHLPRDQSQWAAIFLGIMGSPDAQYGRQVNGMGGGESSLSKICVVGPPSEAQRAAGIDVEYTFAQVGIRDKVVHYLGNCGNLSTMIGVFAVDEGICAPRISQGPQMVGTVRMFNSNTNKRIDNTFLVGESGGHYVPLLEGEQASISGVSGRAAPIHLDFVSPSGARTGKLLPSSRPRDTVCISLPSNTREVTLPVSLVDAAGPTVFTCGRALRAALGIGEHVPIDYADSGVLDALERIRKAGARLMGLDPLAQAQPKVAVLEAPPADDVDADIVIRTVSMGMLHRTVPMTVAVCLGVAARVPHTLASDAVAVAVGRRARPRPRDASTHYNELLHIRHPGGVVEVGAELDGKGVVTNARVMRTGRRLMKGVVWW